METTTKQGNLAAEIALLLAVGVALGLGYNALGLQEGAGWGIAWRGEDKFGDFVDEAQEVAAVEQDSEADYTPVVSDDPLAPAPTAVVNVPDIPDVGRPVKIQLLATKQLFDADAALFVDAREAWEYDEGHIAGAVSLPYDTAVTDPERLERLDSGGRPIVVYCGGGTCEISLHLAEELVFTGYHPRVAVYMGGFPEWVGAGYPVEGATP